MKYTNSELPHIWAKQIEDASASASNFFFEGTKIYSYGYHFCIAEFLTPSIVVYNSGSYSNSTSKHQSYVLSAIGNHIETIYLESGFQCPKSKVIEEAIASAEHKIDMASRARTLKDMHLNNAHSALKNALRYIEVTKTRKKAGIKLVNKAKRLLKSIEANDVQGIQERIKKERIKAKNARIKAQKERFDKEVDNFRSCRSFSAYSVTDFPMMLRVNKHTECNKESYLRIETSKNAFVSLDLAEKLYKMLKRGKDIKGFKIDGYTVISLINGVLKIGCHDIPMSEVEAIAKQLDWSN